MDYKESVLFDNELSLNQRYKDLNQAIADDLETRGTSVSLPCDRVKLIKQEISQLVSFREYVSNQL